MPGPTDIDIILPCYNPAKDWDAIVLERLDMLRAEFPGKRIRAFVVNDGSKRELVKDGLSKLEHADADIEVISYQTNKGKGYAIRTGVGHANAPVIVYTDIDFPYSVESMHHVINPVLKGEADVSLAVRNQTYYSQLPGMRRWMSNLLRRVNRVVLRLHTSDTQGGLKAFRDSARDTFLSTKINRYLFDLEFIYLVSRIPGIRITTVDADLRDGIRMSPVRLKILIGESWNFLKVFLKSSRTQP